MTSAISSRSLPPSEAQKLVVDLEHAGVPPRLIKVQATSPTGQAAMSGSDQRSVGRVAQRAQIGALSGLVIGAAVGLLIGAVTSLSLLQTALPGAIVGLLLGALIGVYSRLSFSRDQSTIDSNSPTVISIDLSGVDEDLAATASEQIRSA